MSFVPCFIVQTKEDTPYIGRNYWKVLSLVTGGLLSRRSDGRLFYSVDRENICSCSADVCTLCGCIHPDNAMSNQGRSNTFSTDTPSLSELARLGS